MALHASLPGSMNRMWLAPERRFLVLFLPYWPTDYLKRRDGGLKAPLALYERIKGGLRLAAVDGEGMRLGLRLGQNLADARALVPGLTVLELDRALLEAGFADFADWHSNMSPLVSVLTDTAPYGDLVLDITGASHLFGGETEMLRLALSRLRALNYSVAGAVAPTIGAAWALSHFARSQVVNAEALENALDALPVHALRLDEKQIGTLVQMGLNRIGQLRKRPRKPLQARFGASLLLRLDQAYGEIEERMTPRLPPVEHMVERRFADPIALMDDVLAATQDLAVKLSCHLEQHGLGAQSFHLFVYRVDHKVMTLSLNASRLTRDPVHIAELFRQRAQRLEGDYDPGFGIDMVRLAVTSTDRLDAAQASAFATESGLEDVDRLLDRLGSRLGAEAVLRGQLVASHVPERAARLVPAMAGRVEKLDLPPRIRPVRLLPQPDPVMINAEVPDGLPASMIWRRQAYRLVKAAGPERIGAEWWRSRQNLQLTTQSPGQDEGSEPGPPSDLPREGGGAASSLERHSVPITAPTPSPLRGGWGRGDDGQDLQDKGKTAARTEQPPPYIPNLPVFDPDAGTRDYYVVEDEEGRRFWVFRLGLYGGGVPPAWYLHGLFP